MREKKGKFPHFIKAAVLHLFAFSSSIGWAQTTLSDTLSIDSSVVWSLRIPTIASLTSGNIHQVSTEALHDGFSPDLQTVLNNIPGVYMETRGTGGSRRLQIRSSGLRSPFGVRNIQMIMNGFMITNASGNAPLESWNPQWMHNLEILKGPSGALYGNSYGGVLIGHSLAPFDESENSVEGFSQYRGTGNPKGTVASESGFAITRMLGTRIITVQSNWNQNPGFREQESNQSFQSEIHVRSNPSEQTHQHLWAGWMQKSWELPGSISEHEMIQNPLQAPGERYNAMVDRKRQWLAWSHSKTKDNHRSGLWVYGQLSQKENPFGTSRFYHGLKTETEQFGSLRYWHLSVYPLGSTGKLSWDQSVIIRTENFSIQEFDGVESAKGLRYDIDSKTRNYWASTGLRLEWNETWQADAQLALERMDRTSKGISNSSNELGTIPYQEAYEKISPLPFLQISKQIQHASRVFISWGQGGSHPTNFELVEPGTFQPANLLPERAESLDFGIRLNELMGIKNQSLTLQGYFQNVKDAIASVPGPNDGLFLGNIDGLTMAGLEVDFGLERQFKPAFKGAFRTWGTVNRHSFNPLAEIVPGTPLHTFGSTGFLQYHSLRFGWNHCWFDRTKLHNDLDDWAAAHHRVRLFLGLDKIHHNIQFGIDNLLDTDYSNWLQTNAFNGRYFNPAPPRTLWISWRWKFESNAIL
ncbi:MAG: TonB-dependent receptor [Flavobacteriales bacterium]